ncbi:zinc-dependent metalloprotease [Limibacter armeniacum]|uniref:zinc-dependent metalloprotease n=1 Tax=Limibacter armeniacum TaxID=466084 RepID=UPI002FE6C149
MKTNSQFFLGFLILTFLSLYAPSGFSKEVTYSGFIDFSYATETGKVQLKIDQLDKEFLYVNSLVSGVGSNDIGLDRGQLGHNRVVKFQRAGNKILLIQPNYDYRAVSDNPEEAKSVREAFAQSVLWGFKIEKEENGAFWVDATDFFIRDVHNVTGTLKNAKQGNYKLDGSRSAIYKEGTKSFPKNSEFEVILTFTGSPEGSWVRSVVPSPEAITVRQRHSFIELPDNDFELRPFDPRSGFFSISYQDYATPIDQPLTKRLPVRHRLKKKDPAASVSEAIEPLVYYLDRGAPEPIRSALMEGASWWNQAFEAAGYKNAFRVELLPEDADLLDVRYNVIQWVHRSTRGWSYGASVIDPRTGEIIKGHISLGSLRVRQDYLIAQGLLSPSEDGVHPTEEMKAMALARLRQLAAHEVGHTLGIAHNFAASVNNRASVMDYPHPLIELSENGSIDISNAYATGIGEWDKQVIKWGYSDFPEGSDKPTALEKIIQESLQKELRYLSDRDARPYGSAAANAHLWDNGQNAAQELQRLIKVREVALQKINPNSLSDGSPMATFEDILVPVYLMHRYQAEATAKVIGGIHYTYAVKGDGQEAVSFVTPHEQKQALDALLKTLTPQFLSVPNQVLNNIPPMPMGYSKTREHFGSHTGLTFDPIAAAESSVNHCLSLLLNGQRATRLIQHHAMDKTQPSLLDITNTLLDATIKMDDNNSNPDSYQSEIQRMVNERTLHYLLGLAANSSASSQAKAIALYQIENLENWLKNKKSKAPEWQAHNLLLAEKIKRFKLNPDAFADHQVEKIPDGSPIGMHCGF